MRRLVFAPVLLVLLVASPAWAEVSPAKAHYWVLGGAAQGAADKGRVTIWDGGGLSVGLASPSVFTGPVVKGMQLGGFLAWQGEDYRLDAILAPVLDGTFSAGFGASAGARPGEVGTSYGVHFGAAFSGEKFTVNPAGGLGLAEMTGPSNDLNVTVTINHALTPNLSVIGTAEARHGVGPTPDGGAGQNRFILGAGLGYRF